jgi:hypothetical protein
VLLRLISVRLATPLDHADKMLLTDLCNRPTTRAPDDRSTFPGSQLALRTTAGFFSDRDRVLPCGAEPPCGNSTPVGYALDGASPASAATLTMHPAAFGATWLREPHPRGRGRPGLALSAELRAGGRPLTLPVAPHDAEHARCSNALRNQNRFHRPLVKENGFPGSERLSSTSAPKESRFRGNLRFAGTRHRSRGFATDDPASDALSPSRLLSHGRARPDRRPRGLFVHGRDGPRAACRLLQSIRSASTTTNRQTPQNPASGRPPAQPISWRRPFGRSPELRMATPFSRRSQPRYHGPGASPEAAASMLGASHRDRSRRELRPNPISSDTSCRCSLQTQAGDACAAAHTARV